MKVSAKLLACLTALVLLSGGSCGQHQGMNPGIEPSPAPERDLTPGTWGGDHISMDVTDTGVTVEFDCAHGSIDGPVPLDDAGAFSVDGLYFQEHGGPVNAEEPPTGVKARFAGTVSGSQMTLTVLDLDSQQKIGAYTLSLGASGRVTKCL